MAVKRLENSTRRGLLTIKNSKIIHLSKVSCIRIALTLIDKMA